MHLGRNCKPLQGHFFVVFPPGKINSLLVSKRVDAESMITRCLILYVC